MKKAIISTLAIILTFFTLLSIGYSVQDFSVNPTDITETVKKGDNQTGTITISSTGNESIDLTITKADLELGSDTITLNINKTQINGLVNGTSYTLSYNYSPSMTVDLGEYDGSITVENSDNSSQTTTISFTVTVEESDSGDDPRMEIEDESDDTVEITGELDEKEDYSFTLVNTGNIDFTNIEVKFSDLEGDDSNDEIDRSDIEVLDEDFDLDVGEERRVDFEIDIDDNIDLDRYDGTITVETDEGYEFEFYVELDVEGGDVDIEIDDFFYDADDGLITMIGEEGESIDGYRFQIENNGDFDVNNIRFEVEDDLEEEFSNAKLPKSAFSFSPDEIDLDRDDDDDIEVEVDIPNGQASGTYFGKIVAVSSSGNEEYDEIRVKVKVTGDVYIKDVTYDDNTNPGDDLDVEVIVDNQGSKVYRNVKVTGTLFDVDYGNNDIVESTSSFILDISEEKTQKLRFRIPEDAKDGSSTLEIRLQFDDQEVVEVHDVNIERPVHKIDVKGSNINPGVVDCEETIYSYIKVKNLGRYDERVSFSVEIEGTSVRDSTDETDLDVDETMQKNFVLDVENLEVGTYKVIQKVEYANGLFLREESTLIVNECVDEGGIDVNPIEDNSTGTGSNGDSSDKNNNGFFGDGVSNTTIYLAVGTGFVILLIIISLFFL